MDGGNLGRDWKDELFVEVIELTDIHNIAILMRRQ